MPPTTLTTTTNFVIQYDSTQTDTLQRAQALALTCESDFTKALSLFGIVDGPTAGFGTSGNLISLQVMLPEDGQADNQGYQTANGTIIQVNPMSTGGGLWTSYGLNGVADEPIADQIVRMFFVAELAEVLMAYRTQVIGQQAWNPSSSDGEGLSRICAELFYPDVCYRDFSPPNIAAWMISNRSASQNLSQNNDWVTTNGVNGPNGNYGDLNGLSCGCAMLFIYYLTTQLGVPLTTIIINGGQNLKQTYTNLQTLAKSGGLNNPQLAQAPADAYTGLVNLINQFFPVAHTPSFSTDNPFPLLDYNTRSITLTQTTTVPNGPKPVGKLRRKVKVSAGGNCPPKEYFYQIMDQFEKVLFTVTTYGFGQPRFAWSICSLGIPVSGSRQFDATVLVDQPGEPGAPSSQPHQIVFLNYSIAGNSPGFQQLSNEMELDNYNRFPGHIVVPVQVSVTEAYASTQASTASIVAVIDTEFVQYDDQFYKDRSNCIGAFVAKLRDHGNPHWINILLTLPDPVPGDPLGVFVFDQALQELQVMAQQQPELAKSVARALSARLGLSASRLLALSKAGGAVAGAVGT